jgi:hypothetical protein
MSLLLRLIAEGIVNRGNDERCECPAYVSDDEFVMDFGMIAIPSTQIAPNFQFSRRAFGLLFQGAPIPHPPRRFPRTPTRRHQIQPPFNQFVYDFGRFHLFRRKQQTVSRWIIHAISDYMHQHSTLQLLKKRVQKVLLIWNLRLEEEQDCMAKLQQMACIR